MDRINDNNYTQWIERFLDAETTLDQEHELYAYFSRPDLPEGARRYREMFEWYDGLQTKDDAPAAPVSRHIPSLKLLPLRRWQWGCVAAVIALLFAAGHILRTPPAMYSYVAEDGCIYRGYMIRDGKRITDRAVIAAEQERIDLEIDSYLANLESCSDEFTAQLRDEIMSSFDSDDTEIRSAIEAALTL